MAETTNISWADATLNYWVGCSEVSNGPKGACENCYARTWSKRFPAYRDTWGAHAARVKTKHPFTKARKIMREAQDRGIARPFIFSNSLADIMDNQVPIEWLAEALQVAEATPEAIHLWLTKRPGLFVERISAAMALIGMEWMPANIALGMTAVTQAEIERDWRKLDDARRELQPAFTFISIEPMMEHMDLAKAGAIVWNAGGVDGAGDYHEPEISRSDSVDWVISGGESGHHARITLEPWERSLRDQCAEAGIPYHRKQVGEWKRTGEVILELHEKDRWREMGRPTTMKISSRMAIVVGNESLPGDTVALYEKVGKDAAGRMLDGVVHDARPEVRTA